VTPVQRDYWIYGVLGAAAVLGAWVLFVGLPRWYPPDPPPTATGATPSTPTEGELVNATLFYISDDGMRLVGFERRLERRAEPAAQARVILEAQLSDPPAPLLSPIPPGTRLLALYLTERGDAFVDLSEEVALGHSGGSLEELFTVYAIVNALTTNLPAIDAVQILINGREVDTLVGHVDLQRPLERNMQWVADPEAEPAPEPTI
jgi:spore germination protein GerM